MNSILICCAGTGGTGKTTTVDAIMKMVADKPGSVHIIRSVVRQYYASKGVPTEAAFLLMPPKYRRDFQIGLYEYYLASLEEEMRHPTAPIMICERSIFDHWAHILYSVSALVDGDMMEVLNKGVDRFAALSPRVMYFPYPTPWDYSASVADGFRAREPAKDAIIDALIHKQLSNHRGLWAGTMAFAPPEVRACAIMNRVGTAFA